ncbi:pepsinogen c [Xylariomycetidae sp. FL0641]|nr:pepsinogen c [Xylariomycetidae sp. FL0641]
MLFDIRSPASALALASVATARVFDLPITFRNTYAIVDVEVGTPLQPHTLLFDTGSATTWLVDSECSDECANYSGWPRSGYSLDASSTSSELGTYAEITYLGGVTSGSGAADTFGLDGATWNQTFLLANESSWAWIPADGLLGLAFSTIADAGAETMVETMLQAGELDQPRFAIYYGTEFNNTGDGPGAGVLTFGGSEEAKYVDGDLTWVTPLQKLDNEHQVWRATLRTVTGSFEGDDGGEATTTPLYQSGSWGVFDTGSGTISVPPLMVEAIYRSIGMNYSAIAAGDHIPLCSEFDDSWSVAFAFGESDEAAAASTVTMTGSQLARPGFADRADACWPPFDAGETNGFFLFGTPMLREFYTVWDFGADEVAQYQPRLGFGVLKEEFKP